MSDNEVSEYPDCRTHDHDKPCPFCLNEQDEQGRIKNIEELQAEVERFKTGNSYLLGLADGERHVDFNLHVERDALAQQIKRLREALKNITLILGPTVPACCEGAQAEMESALEIAKAALSESPKGEGDSK